MNTLSRYLGTIAGTLFWLVLAAPITFFLPGGLGEPLFKFVVLSLAVLAPIAWLGATAACWRVFLESVRGTSPFFDGVATGRLARVLGLGAIVPALLFAGLGLVLR